MGRPVTSGSVAYLDDPKVEPVDVCDKSLFLEKENAEETVGGIMEGKFKPKPGESCGRCDQKPICRWKK
jgi:hypothetical protein